MAYKDRLELIREIERRRTSRVICYLTSLKPNLEAGIHMSDVRVLADHLLGLGERKVKKLDLFICSNGGDVNVPWRMLSMLRDYTKTLEVLIPFSAHSAATMLALGGDKIVMHRLGVLGPIDPSIKSPYTPLKEGYGNLPLSVEDVRWYLKQYSEKINFNGRKESAEIELRVSEFMLKGVETLLRHVHPIALGSVGRTARHARELAKKIIASRANEKYFGVDKDTFDDFVETMFDSFHDHSHNINREEAKQLNLPTELADPDIEDLMWRLYTDFETQFGNVEPMDLASQLYEAGMRDGRCENDQPWNASVGTSVDFEDTFTILESTLRSDAYVEANRATVVAYDDGFKPRIKLVNTFKGWKLTPKSQA